MAIPLPRVIERFQFDVETDNQVPFSDSDEEQANHIFQNDSIPGDDSGENPDHDDEHALIVQLFGQQIVNHEESIPSIAFPALTPEQQQSPELRSREDGTEHSIVSPFESPSGQTKLGYHGDHNGEDDVIDAEDEVAQPWNFPISTFDRLGSEDRQYVRHKSKQMGGTLERDDGFFRSTIFLDCVAQSERSRRLTVRAVDLLCQQRAQSTPVSSSDSALPIYSTTLKSSQSAVELSVSEVASSLVDNLNANFTRKQSEERFEVHYWIKSRLYRSV